MRILDGLKIKYATLSYEDDGEHELSRGAAENIAAKLGINPAACFKTIVMRNESKQIFVFCQSAIHEINLKKARNAAGCKEIGPVKPEELMALTGYIRGGCSPVGMKKKYPTWFDETAMLYDEIAVSAGVRGAQIIVNPDALKDYVEAAYGDVT